MGAWTAPSNTRVHAAFGKSHLRTIGSRNICGAGRVGGFAFQFIVVMFANLNAKTASRSDRDHVSSANRVNNIGLFDSTFTQFAWALHRILGMGNSFSACLGGCAFLCPFPCMANLSRRYEVELCRHEDVAVQHQDAFTHPSTGKPPARARWVLQRRARSC